MKKFIFLSFTIFFICVSCSQKDKNTIGENAVTMISENTIQTVRDSLLAKYGTNAKFRIERGVKQAASLWRKEDGKEEDFVNFCLQYFIPDTAGLDKLARKVSRNFEILNGYFNTMSLELQEPLHLDMGPVDEFDKMIGSFNPSSHLNDDLFSNKIAFVIALNFPLYSLKEKESLAPNWTDREWVYARIGDMFNSRVPAEYQQNISNTLSKADLYISEYNIMMGYLLDNNGKTLFPKDMKLISHWNLRDELKSNYGKENGFEKQKMIYQVMLHIINQTIPQKVINSTEFYWNPITNKLFKNGQEVSFEREPDTRYQILLDNFKALSSVDQFYPQYPDYIQRKFDMEMEITQPEVEKIFTDFISSPLMAEIGQLISKRLGRPLEPFDIWYDGFKARSRMNEEELDKITSTRYPDTKSFEKDMPVILQKLGFDPDTAEFIASHIQVDPARGAGHAWGAEMRKVKSHLRTRIGPNGMNYKGYNIAIHEFGHNVEQTISLHFVNDYMLHGVPNTAFTEALAFIFQKRDLWLLGFEDDNELKKNMEILDLTWSTYEIMGVSLVDMEVWKWLYAHPDATAQQLREAVINIARDIWNQYYAPVFGVKDSPILAIYSHMIDYPLYLPAYPLGHLIDFQIEQYIRDKDFAKEITRIYKQGRLTPNVWMERAVKDKISGKSMLEEARKALDYFKGK